MKTVIEQKAELRRRALALRGALSPAQREAASRRIAERVVRLPAFGRARAVHCFLSMPGEVDTTLLFEACLEAGKATYVPYVPAAGAAPAAGRLGVAHWSPGEPLQRGVMGVSEPLPQARLSALPETLDLVIVPGLAFSRSGARLGYGKGYYDAFLSALAAVVPGMAPVGVAFACQIVPHVPVEAWDVALPLLATEAELIAPG